MSTAKTTEEAKKNAAELLEIMCGKSVRWLKSNAPSIAESLDVSNLITPDKKRSFIESLINSMQLNEVSALLEKTRNGDDTPENVVENTTTPKVIFIVHGNSVAANNAIKDLKLFCSEQDLSYVILKDKPSGGKTIIEKLVSLSDSVGYAIILYTGCDKGRRNDETNAKLKPRARQNVVFEHGFFTAKLGRKNVCVLRESGIEDTVKENPGIEDPSDISGVVYIEMDAAATWRKKLAKELEEAGFQMKNWSTI